MINKEKRKRRRNRSNAQISFLSSRKWSPHEKILKVLDFIVILKRWKSKNKNFMYLEGLVKIKDWKSHLTSFSNIKVKYITTLSALKLTLYVAKDK